MADPICMTLKILRSGSTFERANCYKKPPALNPVVYRVQFARSQATVLSRISRQGYNMNQGVLPLPSLSLPSLRNVPLKISYGVWGSTVSSPAGEFGLFSLKI